MTPWWELCSGDEYSVEHEGRILVFEGGYGDDGGFPPSDADVALVGRLLGAKERVPGTFCDAVEEACDAAICGQLPTTAPVNDTALERAFALLAAPQKSTPAGEDTPAG